MPALRTALLAAHRAAARAAGTLSLAIERGSATRDALRALVAALRAAADRVERALDQLKETT